MSFFDDAISTIGRDLAQTAAKSLSDATGFDVGGTLNVLFGNGQSTGGETLSNLPQALENAGPGLSSADLAVLQASVAQQTQMVTDIGNQLGAIATDIQEIKGEIADMEAKLEKIGQEQLYQEWQFIDSQITEYLVAIQTSYTTYGEYVANAFQTQTSDAMLLADDILNTNVGPRDASNAISKFILDDGQARGVLQLWSNMVSFLVAAGVTDHRDAVNQYMAYYKKLAYGQLQATNLLMEAYNLKGMPKQANNVWAEYRANLLAQEDVFIQWLVPLIAAGITAQNDSGFWAYGPISASLQLNPGVQRLPAASDDTGAYYAPTSLFLQAENLLATLYVTDPTDRRIVVHMLYQGEPEIRDLVKGVDLTLSSDAAGEPVSATRSRNLGAPYTFLNGKSGAGPDLNYFACSFYLKRFVYEASEQTGFLDDGTYSITNINGQDGLVPIETYLAAVEGNPNPSFMNDGPLGYTLAINETSPFAFMNFLTYNVPTTAPDYAPALSLA